MSDLIHQVADLIDERDREGLEATLARVAFQLSRARALTLWRAFPRVDGVWLRKRAALPEPVGASPPQEGDLPLAFAREPLRRAYETNAVARWRGEAVGCVLPVLGDKAVLGLIEIETGVDLDGEGLSLLLGMLRIYRSHLAALDYGDIDELTGLANRRTFDDQFGRFLRTEARRHGAKRIDDAWDASSHLGVADIDLFKQINDRFGHPYGDEVLMLFAALMRETFRDADKLFRFGGEEFVILMSNCGLDDALAAFERFRSAVATHRFPQVGKVTVSIGVTSMRLHDTGSAAFGRADQALYVAKRSGRDRVLLFEAMENSPVIDARATPSEAELF